MGIQSIRKTKEQFIEGARSAHGDKYDYSKVEYLGNKIKVCIICPEHGEFWMKPNNHISGGANCPYCAKRAKWSFEDAVEKAKEVHGDIYTYNRLLTKNGKVHIEIMCPTHGIFVQSITNHIHLGTKCPFCNGTGKKDTASFIKDAVEKYGGRFDYSKVVYTNNKTKVCIICKEHGEFYTTPDHFLNRNKHGCPYCTPKAKYVVRDITNRSAKRRFRMTHEPMYVLRLRMRDRFKAWLRTHNVARQGTHTKRVEALINMDRIQFLRHIESLFTDDMTWENIHLDHHIPVAYMNPTNEYDNKLVWNWYNIRPLHALDNRKKHAVLPDDYEETLDTLRWIVDNNITSLAEVEIWKSQRNR